MANTKNGNWSRYHGNRLLIFGLLVTGLGLYQFTNLLTFKSQLTEIKGVLSSADVYVTTVTERSRGTKSQKSELIFYLSGRQQKFGLVENIGSNYKNLEFEQLRKSLRRADSVAVWVKQSEVENYEPKVFQIDADRKTILEFEKVRTKDSGLTLFLLFLGLSTIYFRVFYAQKLQDAFKSTNSKTKDS